MQLLDSLQFKAIQELVTGALADWCLLRMVAIHRKLPPPMAALVISYFSVPQIPFIKNFIQKLSIKTGELVQEPSTLLPHAHRTAL
ncbi:hypothetical protein NF673_14950 [Pseudomonas moraviensis]|uniref:hypothetical protein n=1 Tax=Pseudomonas moraviensis TaxID=321662 RepID=UPI002093B49A|nr:hypothetical protein [Pseudomonas moraviensis]UST61942.1 hypothetical protein NF673_14950 [Pseudomonas moraviensis]